MQTPASTPFAPDPSAPQPDAGGLSAEAVEGTLPALAGSASANPHQVFLDSLALFQGRRTVEIHHNGAVYRLQSTRAGKLILTK